MHSDAIRSRASRATPPKVRVPAGCLAAGGALQLTGHRAVVRFLPVSSDVAPLQEFLEELCSVTKSMWTHVPQISKGIQYRKEKIQFPHSPQGTKYLALQYVSLPGRWELSETTHSLFSLPIVTPTSGLLQMTGEHPNLHKAGGDRSCVLEKFTKIDNLHIAASICLGLRDLSSSIYIKYSSLKRLHVFKQAQCIFRGEGWRWVCTGLWFSVGRPWRPVLMLGNSSHCLPETYALCKGFAEE